MKNNFIVGLTVLYLTTITGVAVGQNDSWQNTLKPQGQVGEELILIDNGLACCRIVLDWAAVHDQLYVWDYVTNYDHYMAPMPNMNVVADNIRFYAEHNVKGVMTQAGYGSPGVEREWMRSWVFAKLMWNPDWNVENLMHDFIFGHYGKAAPFLWQYNMNLQNQAKAYQKYMDAPEDGIRYSVDHPFLTSKFLRDSTALFDQAEAAAENIDILQRVQKEELPIMYVRLMREPDYVGADYGNIIDKFEAVARRENVTHLAEHYSNLDEQIGIWRLQWHAYKESH